MILKNKQNISNVLHYKEPNFKNMQCKLFPQAYAN